MSTLAYIVLFDTKEDMRFYKEHGWKLRGISKIVFNDVSLQRGSGWIQTLSNCTNYKLKKYLQNASFRKIDWGWIAYQSIIFCSHYVQTKYGFLKVMEKYLEKNIEIDVPGARCVVLLLLIVLLHSEKVRLLGEPS